MWQNAAHLCNMRMTIVNMRIISQLIKDFSRVLQKSLKYFNDTIISTSFVTLSPVLPVTFFVTCHLSNQ